MDDTLKVYWDALERLMNGNPINVEPGGRITNDQVSLEAGRGRGAIKKSRPAFAALIEAIKNASAEKDKPTDGAKEKYLRKCAEAKKYRALYEEAIAREISMLKQIRGLQQTVNELRNPTVAPIGD